MFKYMSHAKLVKIRRKKKRFRFGGKWCSIFNIHGQMIIEYSGGNINLQPGETLEHSCNGVISVAMDKDYYCDPVRRAVHKSGLDHRIVLYHSDLIRALYEYPMAAQSQEMLLGEGDTDPRPSFYFLAGDNFNGYLKNTEWYRTNYLDNAVSSEIDFVENPIFKRLLNNIENSGLVMLVDKKTHRKINRIFVKTTYERDALANILSLMILDFDQYYERNEFQMKSWLDHRGISSKISNKTELTRIVQRSAELRLGMSSDSISDLEPGDSRSFREDIRNNPRR